MLDRDTLIDILIFTTHDKNQHTMTTREIHSLISINELSSILWILDPMNTCCGFIPGMCDEYDTEAKKIKDQCSDGKSMQQALLSVFEEMFWEGCWTRSGSPVSIDTVVAAIEDYLSIDKKTFTAEEASGAITKSELEVFVELNSRISENRQFSFEYIQKYHPLFDNRPMPTVIEID